MYCSLCKSVQEVTVHVIYYLFVYFILPALFGSIWSVWAPSYFGQGLVRRHALSFIFHGIYDFKEAKSPVTAARNYTSVLQRHNETLPSAIPYRLSPGGVKSHCVGTKHKNNSRTILKSTPV